MLVVGEPIFGGSHTPSMVGAVQAWRKRDPDKTKAVWAALADANLSVEKGLLRLKDAAQSEDSYKSTLQACSTSTTDQVLVSRQRHAFPSNFVHSLDSSHMM